MARDWDSVFNTWSKGPGQAEDDKCCNAETAIKKAINSSKTLTDRGVRVFTQGSYRNRTNVRGDSDVDVCVMCNGLIMTEYTGGITREELGQSVSDYTFAQYKSDVQSALQNYFGKDKVVRGNKAFDVHETSHRVDADVVPAWELREYYRLNGQIRYREGLYICSDTGTEIHNYPQQHYDEGCAKNDATNRHFKRVARILKRLRNEMADNQQPSAKPMPSFLLESLAWNVPNSEFRTDGYREDVRRSIIHLYNATKTDEACKEAVEVNAIKYLFRVTQPWARQAVNDFLLAAWKYAEYNK